MRVLVVEDDRELGKTLCDALDEEGFSPDWAADGRQGLAKALAREYDAIVLDLMIPGIDGWTLLGRLREKKKTPVLILTARDALTDKVRGLDTGADDYLTKPFALEELFARLRSLLRRAATQPAPIVRVGDVTIDLAARRVFKGDAEVPLAAKEYATLEYLMLHRGRLVTRRMLQDHLYDEHDETVSNVVEVYVAALRKKLGAELIETRRGQGYIIHG